jgi:Domain of unknown function (DUF4145)
MTDNTTRAPCRLCLRETKHAVVASRVVQHTQQVEYMGEVWFRDTYEMLQCGGCEVVCLRHTYDWSEDPEPEVTYYPPPVSRAKPPWRNKLPSTLRTLLSELYAALHADSRRLALMGARTVLDMVLLEKVGDAGSFQHKLLLLEKRGYVGQRSREILAAALDAGSAATHRGYLPKMTDLQAVMDIMENVLQAVYVLEGAAAELRKTTPQRGKPTHSKRRPTTG